jgi:hypothetical protein
MVPFEIAVVRLLFQTLELGMTTSKPALAEAIPPC